VTDDNLLRRFEDHVIDAEAMTHENHLRLAWLLLRKYPLPEAMMHYRDGLLALTTRLGLTDKYHETITFTLMLVLYDRMAHGPDDLDAFLAANQDLLTDCKGVLTRWYRAEDLFTDAARLRFRFPDPAHAATPAAEGD